MGAGCQGVRTSIRLEGFKEERAQERGNPGRLRKEALKGCGGRYRLGAGQMPGAGPEVTGWKGELQPFPRKWEERGCRSLHTSRALGGAQRLVPARLEGRRSGKGVQVPDPSSPCPRALGRQASWSQEEGEPGFGNVEPLRVPGGSARRLTPERGNGEESGVQVPDPSSPRG